MTTRSEELAEQAQKRGIAQVIDAPMAKTSVWFYPAAQNNNGTLILVHGYRGTHHGLEAIVGALDDFDCYVMDLPGFGETASMRVEHSVENYAEWLRQIVEAIGEPNSIVVAHSFGTLVAGCYASENHQHRIALINPISAPALDGPRTLMTKVTSWFYKNASRLPSRASGWLLASPVIAWSVSEFMYHGDSRELKSWVKEQHRSYFSRFADSKSVAESFRASVTRNLQMYARRIHQPTLLICTEKDDITSIKTQREVAALYPRASYVEIPKLGHLIHYEGPEIVASNLRQFAKATS